VCLIGHAMLPERRCRENRRHSSTSWHDYTSTSNIPTLTLTLPVFTCLTPSLTSLSRCLHSSFKIPTVTTYTPPHRLILCSIHQHKSSNRTNIYTITHSLTQTRTQSNTSHTRTSHAHTSYTHTHTSHTCTHLLRALIDEKR
jgi:hypothetical protein